MEEEYTQLEEELIEEEIVEELLLVEEEIKDLLKGILPSRDDFDNDINTPKKPATSVPKTGGSATAPAN